MTGPMTGTPTVVLGSLGDALPPRQNAVFTATRPFSAAPSFSPPFPVREVGVLFAPEGAAAPSDRTTLPCCGLFSDVPPDLHAACAANVTVLCAEASDRFVVELATRDADTRLVVARTPRAATLGATIEPVVAEARRGPSFFGRLLGKTRFTAEDVLKVPPLSVEAEGVSFRLAGGGSPIPPGERTLGRGEMYRRYFVCDRPFVVLLLSKASGEVELALRVEDAAAIQG